MLCVRINNFSKKYRWKMKYYMMQNKLRKTGFRLNRKIYKCVCVKTNFFNIINIK